MVEREIDYYHQLETLGDEAFVVYTDRTRDELAVEALQERTDALIESSPFRRAMAQAVEAEMASRGLLPIVHRIGDELIFNPQAELSQEEREEAAGLNVLKQFSSGSGLTAIDYVDIESSIRKCWGWNTSCAQDYTAAEIYALEYVFVNFDRISDSETITDTDLEKFLYSYFGIQDIDVRAAESVKSANIQSLFPIESSIRQPMSSVMRPKYPQKLPRDVLIPLQNEHLASSPIPLPDKDTTFVRQYVMPQPNGLSKLLTNFSGVNEYKVALLAGLATSGEEGELSYDDIETALYARSIPVNQGSEERRWLTADEVLALEYLRDHWEQVPDDDFWGTPDVSAADILSYGRSEGMSLADARFREQVEGEIIFTVLKPGDSGALPREQHPMKPSNQPSPPAGK